MAIKFDSRQTFQIEAIDAVCDLFKGQPLVTAAPISLGSAPGELFAELGVANDLGISQGSALENLRVVQQRNGLALSNVLAGMHFSVEMETGTGKTYVYLRTIFELNARYGFKKFVIVVPSVAIREGVETSIKLTREHFADLYARVPCEARTYDPRRLSGLRQFALSNQLQILIVNIDAFNKATNVMRREQDELSGRKPIEFLSACHPIVIVDEPQNVESDLAKDAIANLSPLCTLRYSATHKNPYNLVYVLDPVRAYDLRLVKRIEVASVMDEANFNAPYVAVENVETGSRVTATLMIDSASRQGVKRKRAKVRVGSDLYEASGNRDVYKNYVVRRIDSRTNSVSFANNVTIVCGAPQGGNRDEVMRTQVRETVEEHFEKEIAVQRLPVGHRVKVLSLFFIDRVANYAAVDGKIRRWFLEAYAEMSARPDFAALKLPPVGDAHYGYFAEQRGAPQDANGSTDADDACYALIMREKERLLRLDVPLRFIFSHSALREGWDNPNVFQICTLNETRSESKKRQEIGRGLRLPVDESGERCHDESINRLTVIANESYEAFARSLQEEIEDECGIKFEGRIANKRERRKVRLKKGWRANADFKALWDRIKYKTRYSVEYSTSDLVAKAVAALERAPPIIPAKVVTTKASINLDRRSGVTTSLTAIHDAPLAHSVEALPDAVGFLQRETELTRATLTRILVESGRLGDMLVDPQEFLDRALREIRQVMQAFMINGIKYERISNAEYEMLLFDDHEIESYVARLLPVQNSIYDEVVWESETERLFAAELDARKDIRFFLKLPRWFKIETPLGTYNPDWAIVKEAGNKVYLVRETKSTLEELKLRGVEWGKIQCGLAHFGELGVDFQAVTSASEV